MLERMGFFSKFRPEMAWIKGNMRIHLQANPPHPKMVFGSVACSDLP